MCVVSARVLCVSAVRWAGEKKDHRAKKKDYDFDFLGCLHPAAVRNIVSM